MGYFGYICNRCKQNIRIDEKAVIQHVRHGEIIGITRGSYSGYGDVKEDDVYRSWAKEGKSTINNHEEISTSEFDLHDSKYLEDKDVKIYKGKYYTDFSDFVFDKLKRHLDMSDKNDIIMYNNLMQEWDILEGHYLDKACSGTAAFHAKCYDNLKPHEENLRKMPSESDPDQGCGVPRKRFL